MAPSRQVAETIARIRRMMDDAPPAPWLWKDGQGIVTDRKQHVIWIEAYEEPPAVLLTRCMRNALPAMLAEFERVLAELDEAKKQLAQAKKDADDMA